MGRQNEIRLGRRPQGICNPRFSKEVNGSSGQCDGTAKKNVKVGPEIVKPQSHICWFCGGKRNHISFIRTENKNLHVVQNSWERLSRSPSTGLVPGVFQNHGQWLLPAVLAMRAKG